MPWWRIDGVKRNVRDLQEEVHSLAQRVATAAATTAQDARKLKGQMSVVQKQLTLKTETDIEDNVFKVGQRVEYIGYDPNFTKAVLRTGAIIEKRDLGMRVVNLRPYNDLPEKQITTYCSKLSVINDKDIPPEYRLGYALYRARADHLELTQLRSMLCQKQSKEQAKEVVAAEIQARKTAIEKVQKQLKILINVANKLIATSNAQHKAEMQHIVATLNAHHEAEMKRMDNLSARLQKTMLLRRRQRRKALKL